MPFYGVPLQIPNRSLESVLIVDPTLGLHVAQPSVDAPLGSTPSAENYILRDGALEVRPMLSLRNTNPAPFGDSPMLGGLEVSDVSGNRFPLISGTTRLAWYSNGSWSVASYVAAGGVNAAPQLAATEFWDATQIYYDRRDENIAVLASGAASYQSLYCWQSNTTVFSTLTGAPQARYVAAYDNYLLAYNILDSTGSAFVQRVQWTDRGSASSWTGGLSGYEDLLDMRGLGTGIKRLENRLILFSNKETWQGFPVDFPFIFRFQPLDRGVGCPYPWTVAETPRGLVFLGEDYHAYLIPKEGGTPVKVGQELHRDIRTGIDQPQRAWAVFDNVTDTYQLYYPGKSGSGYPQRAVYLNVNDGSWAPQTFDPIGWGLSLTRGFQAQFSSSATTWGGLAAASVRWADLTMTWGQLGGASEEQVVMIGSSEGTMYYLNSNATSDNGTAVRSRWRSTAMGGLWPQAQKTLTEVRVDYQAD